MGAPVLCFAEVVQLGEPAGPLPKWPVFASQEAAAADGIQAIDGIEPHTSFHGPYESGLMKMLVVGIDRDKGASMVHRLSYSSIVESIESIGSVVLKWLPVIGGPGIIENAHEETALLKDLPGSEIPESEIQLLELSTTSSFQRRAKTCGRRESLWKVAPHARRMLGEKMQNRSPDARVAAHALPQRRTTSSFSISRTTGRSAGWLPACSDTGTNRSSPRTRTGQRRG